MEPDRFTYSPIVERPPIAWRNGCRPALWVVPNRLGLDEEGEHGAMAICIDISTP